MENKMNYRVEFNHLIVEFYGEIDCVNAPYYRHQLNRIFEENNYNVIFDFKNTSFLDSSGIGLVIGRYNELHFNQRKLIITGLNKVGYHLFELSGLFLLMDYYEAIEDALKEENNETDNGNIV
jgi:stage II sporulation protein AA (anti-sigma F factor antagonist)